MVWLGMVWESVTMVIEHDQANDTKKMAVGLEVSFKNLRRMETTTVQFLLFPNDGAPYIEERQSSFMET